jgi:hypothetical protein
MDTARVLVYLDDQSEPIADYVPPVAVSLDTHELADGEHRLRIEAQDRSGRVGICHVLRNVGHREQFILRDVQVQR